MVGETQLGFIKAIKTFYFTKNNSIKTLIFKKKLNSNHHNFSFTQMESMPECFWAFVVLKHELRASELYCIPRYFRPNSIWR